MRNVFFAAVIGIALLAQSLIATKRDHAAGDDRPPESRVGLRPGLRKGMSLPDAIEVALKCVKEASGFKTKSDRRKVKLYRNEDTLGSLGIASNERLSALRRYIIRNDEIGVQSKYDKSTAAVQVYQPRRYIIERTALDGIKTSSTLLELANAIQSNAGLPRLPYSTASQIVADCRRYPSGGEPADKPLPTPTPLPANANRQAAPVLVRDLLLGTSARNLAKCIVNSREYGISTAGLKTPEDDLAYYFLEFSAPDSKGRSADSVVSIIERNIERSWNYSDLIGFIAENAQIRLPVEIISRDIVVANILKLDPNAVFSFNSKITIVVDLTALQARINSDLAGSAVFLPANSEGSNQKLNPVARIPRNLRHSGQSSIVIGSNDTVGDIVVKVAGAIAPEEAQ